MKLHCVILTPVYFLYVLTHLCLFIQGWAKPIPQTQPSKATAPCAPVTSYFPLVFLHLLSIQTPWTNKEEIGCRSRASPSQDGKFEVRSFNLLRRALCASRSSLISIECIWLRYPLIGLARPTQKEPSLSVYDWTSQRKATPNAWHISRTWSSAKMHGSDLQHDSVVALSSSHV